MSAIDVKLNVFEGPLDLLLHLIEKNKVNIYDIPIVTITEQYLDYVNHMEEEDLDVMSEFLVMAATLIRIKSKMLLPKVTEEDEEEEDPREELVRRLLEYKMYKYAASELKDLELDGAKAFYKKESIPAEVKNFKPTVDPVALISEYDMNLEKLNEIINEHIGNPALDVNMIADLMHLSRPTLYRKIRAISDLTPNELIKISRLKKAAELLIQGNMKIYEISEATGFSSQSYFWSAFIKQFGMSPSNYAKENK